MEQYKWSNINQCIVVNRFTVVIDRCDIVMFLENRNRHKSEYNYNLCSKCGNESMNL